MPVPDAPETLTVRVGRRSLGLPGPDIAEIRRVPPVTRVPLAPPALLGIANLRGQMLPVVSLAVLLGNVPDAAGPAARIVVFGAGARLAVLVDEIIAFGAGAAAPVVDVAALLAGQFSAPAPGAPPTAAAHAATGLAMADPGLEDRALIGLRSGGQDYAMALTDVLEILAMPPGVTPMPGADPAILGVAETRAGLLPLLSLRALLGQDQAPLGPDARILVILLAGRRAGLVADAATSILRVPPDAIGPVPPVLTRGRSEARITAICRVAGRLVAQLSPAGLLDDATLSRLQQLDAAAGAALAAPAVKEELFVVIQLGDAEYGLPIAVVEAVVRETASAGTLPHAPDFVAGAMNLRGRIIPLIDQQRRFGGAPAPGEAGRVVVIVSIGAQQAGLVVDRAPAVLALPAASISPAPHLTAARPALFDRIAPHPQDARTILLVDPHVLLEDLAANLQAAFAARAAIAAHA